MTTNDMLRYGVMAAEEAMVRRPAAGGSRPVTTPPVVGRPLRTGGLRS